MLIEVAVDKHFFKNLEASIKKGGGMCYMPSNDLEVILICNPASPLTASLVHSLVQRLLASDLNKHRLIFCVEGKEFLTPKQVKALLSDAYIVNAMTYHTFTHLILSSDEVAEFALKTPHVRTKLNSLKPISDVQSFPSSCTAFVLMKILRERNLISVEDYTRCTELDIYRQIWIAAGKEACPKKIIEFIKKIKQGSQRQFNIHSIEVSDITENVVNNIDRVLKRKRTADAIESTHARYLKHAYTLFKHAKPDSYEKISQREADTKQFTADDYLLLIERHSGGAHTCLGTKNSDGRFSVFNPECGVMYFYDSFNHYMSMKRGVYVGVTLDIRCRL